MIKPGNLSSAAMYQNIDDIQYRFTVRGDTTFYTSIPTGFTSKDIDLFDISVTARSKASEKGYTNPTKNDAVRRVKVSTIVRMMNNIR